MPEASATAGEQAGQSRSRAAAGKPGLGQIEELGELVYKFNTNDQADKYIRTTEAIANYVGREYGRNMRNLVKHGQEAKFTKPKLGRVPEGQTEHLPGTIEEFKVDLNAYHKDVKEYAEQKAKVFVIILGQCSQAAKSRLESDSGYKTLELNYDVTGLLKKLHEMAFATGGVQEPYWTLQKVIRRLTAISMGPKEAPENYEKRFLAVTKVIEEQWGWFYPQKLAGGTSEAEKKKAQERLYASIFLAGADKRRYGKYVDGLNNAYLTGTDNYPKTVQQAVTALTNYQDGEQKPSASRNVERTGGSGGPLETSFAQTSGRALRRRRCFECGDPTHVARSCPQRRQSLNMFRATVAAQGGVSSAARAARGQDDDDDEVAIRR